MRTAEDRFWAKVHKTDTCWLWTAGTLDGYGRFHGGGSYEKGTARQWKAHRFAYTLHHGPIEDGTTLDHLCRVKNCVNPDHLEPVSALENQRRKPIKRRHCMSCTCGRY